MCGGMDVAVWHWGHTDRAGCSHPQNVEQESGGRGNRGGGCVGMEVSPWQEAPQLASREGKGKEPQDGNSFLWWLTQACHCLPVCSG